jgi:broad specificity phosphatase PhoE
MASSALAPRPCAGGRPRHAEPGATTWDEALDQSGELQTLAAALPPERLAELRVRVESFLDRWTGRPASYVIVVGHRRDTAIAG